MVWAFASEQTWMTQKKKQHLGARSSSFCTQLAASDPPFFLPCAVNYAHCRLGSVHCALHWDTHLHISGILCNA